MQLGFENKKQTMWAAVLGVVAILAMAYEIIPDVVRFVDAGVERPGGCSDGSACHDACREESPGRSRGWRIWIRRCDWICWPRPNRRCTKATGRNIFVSQAEDVVIPKPGASRQ